VVIMKVDFITKFFALSPIKWFIKDIEGVHNLPKNINFIVTSNHPSWWDPIFIVSIISDHYNQKVRYMSSHRFLFLGNTFFRKWAGCIPVYKQDKGESAIREAIGLLNMGEIVGIFPEGIAKPSKKIKGKLGIARLAIESKKPVIPIGLNGVDELAPGESIFPKKFRRITINIGKPMFFDNHYRKNYNKRILRQVTDKIVNNIEALLEQ
jgi:1-acyl-sn-glycerol-3-phosphate acyltransferase